MKKYLVPSMLCLLAAAAVAGNASQDGGLGSLYTEVSGWLNGAPGKLLGLGFIIFGIWSVLRGQILWFFGGIVMAITITLVPGIISSKFTAMF